MTTLTTAPRRAALAFACAALALAARPADAQLRKLKDLGKAAVKGAVEGTAEGAAKKAIGGGESGSPARPATVQFTDNLIEITDARLARFIRGFDAEIAARPAAEKQFAQDVAAAEAAARSHDARLADYERKQKEWEKEKLANQACADALQAKYEPGLQKDMAAGQKAADKLDAEMSPDREKKLQAMSDRMKAAQARGDQVAVRALADTMMREMQGVMAIAQRSNVVAQRSVARSAEMEAELKKCPAVGEPPKRPDMPGSADAEKARRITEDAAAKASGLTAAQYALMKERVETYVRYKGRTGSTQYIFTAGELDALAKQLDELQKRGELAQPSYWYPGKRE